MHRKAKNRLVWVLIFGLSGTIFTTAGAEQPAPGLHPFAAGAGVKAIDYFPPRAEQVADQAVVRAAELSMITAPLSESFTLHSVPGASKVIFLDFDGHDGYEGNYTPFNFEGSSDDFSEAELARIQLVWQSVAEDFLPFDVDVTTEDPGVEALRKFGAGDTHWGIRVVVSGSVWDYSWAYYDSFNWDTDYEAFAWTGDDSWIWIADSASHEVGHSLGLSHDGGGGDGEYYEGHGSGLTHWSPIMGWSGFALSQWSIGEYDGADNDEDDLELITTLNGFGYRNDDHGSTMGTATPVSLGGAELELVAEGNIERTGDVDYFAFTMASAGDLHLLLRPDQLAANLDILAELREAGGALIASSNPPDSLHAAFTISLAAGDYYLSVAGTGLGNPPADGYSNYGCLGYYSFEAMGGTATGISSGVDGATSALRFLRLPANPFTASNSFSFALSQSRSVRALVFDVRGRLVDTLIDGELAAGRHQATWEPRSQGAPAAGLYFVRIDAGDERITARMIYLP